MITPAKIKYLQNIEDFVPSYLHNQLCKCTVERNTYRENKTSLCAVCHKRAVYWSTGTQSSPLFKSEYLHVRTDQPKNKYGYIYLFCNEIHECSCCEQYYLTPTNPYDNEFCPECDRLNND